MTWRLSLACLMIAFLSVSCMQAENSNSADKTTWGSDDTPFGRAKKVMAQNCAQCHPFAGQTEDELAASGDIVKGNADNSKIYQRLNGIGGSVMPTSGALSSGDIGIIRDWINQIP
jgi:mono/diheme cytochrome c family protein